MASSDSHIDQPQRGHPKRTELPDVNINTGAQRANVTLVDLQRRFSSLTCNVCYTYRFLLQHVAIAQSLEYDTLVDFLSNNFVPGFWAALINKYGARTLAVKTKSSFNVAVCCPIPLYSRYIFISLDTILYHKEEMNVEHSPSSARDVDRRLTSRGRFKATSEWSICSICSDDVALKIVQV